MALSSGSESPGTVGPNIAGDSLSRILTITSISSSRERYVSFGSGAIRDLNGAGGPVGSGGSVGGEAVGGEA
jgi:hypothetical protein